MIRTFAINGKTYAAKEFSYNTICDLQDLGIDIDKMGDRGASMDRAFLAIWSGMTVEQAGNEIGKHLMSGGTLEELETAIQASMEESDFFRYLTKTEDQSSPESEEKTQKE